MDVKLQNAYVEVLLGNFMEVVKQNLMFQAQIEVSKNDVIDSESIKRKIEELANSNLLLQKTIQDQGKELQTSRNEIDEAKSIKRKIDELSTSNIQLQKTIQDQGKELQEKNRDLQEKTRQLSSINPADNSNLKQEKDRLQSAVNDYMRQLKSAQQEVLVAKSESQNVLLQNNNRIEELTKYIARLEAVVPATKLKKAKLGDVVQSDTPEIAVEEPVLPIEDNVKSGGTF